MSRYSAHSHLGDAVCGAHGYDDASMTHRGLIGAPLALTLQDEPGGAAGIEQSEVYNHSLETEE